MGSDSAVVAPAGHKRSHRRFSLFDKVGNEHALFAVKGVSLREKVAPQCTKHISPAIDRAVVIATLVIVTPAAFIITFESIRKANPDLAVGYCFFACLQNCLGLLWMIFEGNYYILRKLVRNFQVWYLNASVMVWIVANTVVLSKYEREQGVRDYYPSHYAMSVNLHAFCLVLFLTLGDGLLSLASRNALKFAAVTLWCMWALRLAKSFSSPCRSGTYFTARPDTNVTLADDPLNGGTCIDACTPFGSGFICASMISRAALINMEILCTRIIFTAFFQKGRSLFLVQRLKIIEAAA